MAPTLESSLENRLDFINEQQLPAVVRAAEHESLFELLDAAAPQLAAIQRRFGAILFRGFALRNAEDFHAAAALCFAGALRPYLGGISPRGQIISGVYESTRIPSYLRINLHNEMSYLPDPPRALAFFCEIEPNLGGETPLADSRVIYERIPGPIRARVETHGVRYYRHLYGPRWYSPTRAVGRILKLHASWSAAFSTDSPSQVEQLCRKQAATVRWNWEESALITNTLPAVRKHPETGEKVWFNHVSTFLATPRTAGLARWLLYHAGFPSPLSRPFHATLGNGEPFRLAELDSINHAMDSATVMFRWQRGDLLLVDNLLVAHGRMPFRGNRRILVAIH